MKLLMKTGIWTAGIAAFLAAAAPAGAKERTTGSITVLMDQETAEKVPEFLCAKVGSIVDGEYKLDSGYKDAGVDPDAIETADELREAAGKLAAVSEGGRRGEPDGTGTVCFADLEPGLYLLQAESRELSADPSLAAVPGWDEEKGIMEYDVEVFPKFRAVPQIFDTGYDSPLPLYLSGAAGAGCLLLAVNLRKKRPGSGKRT